MCHSVKPIDMNIIITVRPDLTFNIKIPVFQKGKSMNC